MEVIFVNLSNGETITLVDTIDPVHFLNDYLKKKNIQWAKFKVGDVHYDIVNDQYQEFKVDNQSILIKMNTILSSGKNEFITIGNVHHSVEKYLEENNLEWGEVIINEEVYRIFNDSYDKGKTHNSQ